MFALFFVWLFEIRRLHLFMCPLCTFFCIWQQFFGHLSKFLWGITGADKRYEQSRVAVELATPTGLGEADRRSASISIEPCSLSEGEFFFLLTRFDGHAQGQCYSDDSAPGDCKQLGKSLGDTF